MYIYTLVINLLYLYLYMVDVKRGVPGDTSSTSSSGSVRIISAIQGQRDRYMKASQDKEAALQVMKQRCDQMEDEVMQLRNENMELFRRLRVLRVNQGSSINNNSNNSTSSSSSHYIHSTSSGSGSGGGSEQIDRDDPNLLPSSAMYSSKLGAFTDSRNPNHGIATANSSHNSSSGGIWNAIRSRRFNLMGGYSSSSSSSSSSSTSGGGGERDEVGELMLLSDDGRATTHGNNDPLDEKYMGLYEQDISPFRIQQLDRQLVRMHTYLVDGGV